MPYSTPIFNLTTNVWRSGFSPPDPPDEITLGQLYFYSRTVIDVDPSDSTIYTPPVWLRAPIGTDIRVGDLVEIEGGTGYFYRVRWVERAHLGFPNQYVAALLQQEIVPPPPIPAVAFHTEFLSFGAPQSTLVMAAPPITGNSLLVFSVVFDGVGNSVLSIDMNGTPLALACANSFAFAGGLNVEIWYALVGITALPIFTMNFLAPTLPSGELAYVLNVAGLDALTSVGTNSGASTAPAAAQGAANVNAACYVQAIVGCTFPDPPLSFDPPLADQDVAGTGACVSRAGFEILSAVATPSLAMTGIAPTGWVAAIASFA